MSDFQSFRNAVLEDEGLQEQVISIVNTALPTVLALAMASPRSPRLMDALLPQMRCTPILIF